MAGAEEAEEPSLAIRATDQFGLGAIAADALEQDRPSSLAKLSRSTYCRSICGKVREEEDEMD